MTWRRSIPFPELSPRISDDKIRLTWLTDCHIANEQSGTNWTALQAAVADCNVNRPQALVVTGDIGNNTILSLRNAFLAIRRCQIPVIDVIGNHDEEELVVGSTNATQLAESTVFNQAAPFYFSRVLSSGDGSWSALCLVLDCNLYADDPDGDTPGNSADHEAGDRLGYHASHPVYWRQFGTAQLAWIESQLASDNSDAVFICVHYPPGYHTDYAQLVDKFQADGRPTIGFCGHNHPNATTTTQQSTDTLYTLNIYKCPAMLESGSWTDCVFSFNGDIVIDSMIVRNYTNPGAWTINAPFALP